MGPRFTRSLFSISASDGPTLHSNVKILSDKAGKIT